MAYAEYDDKFTSIIKRARAFLQLQDSAVRGKHFLELLITERKKVLYILWATRTTSDSLYMKWTAETSKCIAIDLDRRRYASVFISNVGAATSAQQSPSGWVKLFLILSIYVPCYHYFVYWMFFILSNKITEYIQ